MRLGPGETSADRYLEDEAILSVFGLEAAAADAFVEQPVPDTADGFSDADTVPGSPRPVVDGLQQAHSKLADMAGPAKLPRRGARCFRRFMPHMRQHEEVRHEIIPQHLWTASAKPPQLPYFAVDDPLENVKYFMCSYCQCDRLHKSFEALLAHINSGDCKQGLEAFQKLHTEASREAGTAPMLLERGEAQPLLRVAAADVAPAPRGRQPKMAPEVRRWQKAAGALLEASAGSAGLQKGKAKSTKSKTPCKDGRSGQPKKPQAKPAQASATVNPAAYDRAAALKEIQKLCPRWYEELGVDQPGRPPLEEQELQRLVQQARKQAASEGRRQRRLRRKCEADDKPGAAQSRACGGIDDCEKRKEPWFCCLTGMPSGYGDLLQAAEARAPFRLSECKSEFSRQTELEPHEAAGAVPDTLRGETTTLEVVQID
eukprot:TRINITY_DN73476_c0_g1_i1.p1 TRINITY_DN73476_c0_g1~~TRINITY_DN73476_c0_g1_i1.p1  ORF type:complete len:429 (-),score=100.49 TRINITY_DN73476_c0_g1_i1:136-1422(-)